MKDAGRQVVTAGVVNTGDDGDGLPPDVVELVVGGGLLEAD